LKYLTQTGSETFAYPDGFWTQAFGLNNRGQIVGSYTDASGSHGFVGTPDDLRSIDMLGGSETKAEAINDWGQIVGSYTDAEGKRHGFLEASNRHFITVDVPKATATTVTGINDWGQLVGSYTDSSGHGHGFVLTAGQFQSLDAPNSSGTSAIGINNLGQIVGSASTTVTDPSGSTLPGTEVWVASPSFIKSGEGDGIPFPPSVLNQKWLPDHQEVAPLLQAITSSDWTDFIPKPAAWTDPHTAGPPDVGYYRGSDTAGVVGGRIDLQSSYDVWHGSHGT